MYNHKNKKTTIKLIDFGLAASLGSDYQKCGTAGYIAPEILSELPYNC